jgi:hypothetical protein
MQSVGSQGRIPPGNVCCWIFYTNLWASVAEINMAMILLCRTGVGVRGAELALGLEVGAIIALFFEVDLLHKQ